MAPGALYSITAVCKRSKQACFVRFSFYLLFNPFIRTCGKLPICLPHYRYNTIVNQLAVYAQKLVQYLSFITKTGKRQKMEKKKPITNQQNRIKSISAILLVLLLFGFAMIAYHDLQIAQGAGLYLAAELGHPSRAPFDLLMDVLGGLSIIICIIIPPLLLKKRTAEAILHFTIYFLALSSIIQPGNLVHITSQFTNWELRQELFSGNFAGELIVHLTEPLAVLLLEVPLIIVFFTVNKNVTSRSLSVWKKILLWISLLLPVMFVLFPGFHEYTLFVLHYFLLIILFDESECFFEHMNKDKSEKVIKLLFFGILALRIIYRVLFLLQNTHL